jgi:hypothetical protein
VFAQSYLLDRVFFPLLLTNGDIQLGLNRFPAQTITEGWHDAQKSIPGTSAQKGSGEGDLTAKNDRKLHPMVQIAQIVREPLDGWVIMSLISHLLREIARTQPHAAHYGPAQQGGATPSCQDWVSLLPLGR